MAKRPASYKRLTALKLRWQRVGPVLLIAVAVGLLVVNKLQSPTVQRVRASVTDALSPILEAMVRPVDGISDWFGAFEGREALLKENAELRRQIDRYKQQIAAMRHLGDENRSLRALLKASPKRKGRHIASRVIGDPGGAYVRSLIVNAGANDGVRKGRAVVNGLGLVGRVTEVGRRSARVLLITDLNSRIPVVVGEAQVRAVLAGNNTGRLRLLYLPRRTAVAVGAKVVTSGHGGVLPPGLAVGVVSKVDGRRAYVTPYVDWDRINFIRIIDYEAPGVILPGHQGRVRGPSISRTRRRRGETASR